MALMNLGGKKNESVRTAWETRLGSTLRNWIRVTQRLHLGRK
jgi:hypothetical protein